MSERSESPKGELPFHEQMIQAIGVWLAGQMPSGIPGVSPDSGRLGVSNPEKPIPTETNSEDYPDDPRQTDG